MKAKNQIPNFLTMHGYKYVREIGHGGFGVCYLANSIKYPDICFAIKVIHDKNQSYYAQYMDELEILKQLDHPNIIKLYDFFKDQDMLFIVLEYCPNGTLESLIKAHGSISEPLLSSYVSQLIDGFTFMHKKSIAHHDIKTTNILIDQNQRLKIADFGFSRRYNLEALSNIYCGTSVFVSPEVIMRKPYDPFKSDIWSIGVTIYHMVNGSYPFTGKNQNDMFVTQMKGLSKSEPQNVYERLWKAMLLFEPKKRPSMEDCQKMFCSESNMLSLQKCTTIVTTHSTRNIRLLRAAHSVLTRPHVSSHHSL